MWVAALFFGEEGFAEDEGLLSEVGFDEEFADESIEGDHGDVGEGQFFLHPECEGSGVADGEFDIAEVAEGLEAGGSVSHDAAWGVLEGCEESDDGDACGAGFDDVVGIGDGELDASGGEFGDDELWSTWAAGDDFDVEVTGFEESERLCGEEAAMFDFGVPVEREFCGSGCGGGICGRI